MTRFRIYPYKMTSEGAIAVRDALIAAGEDALLLRRENSTYTYREGDVIISWGTVAPFHNAINRDPSIAINKLDFYRRLAGLDIVPRFVTTMEQARHALRFPILCRQRVEGADGQGIVIATNREELVQAPLYVELVPKTEEWRVHGGRDREGNFTIIGVQKKLHTVVDGVHPEIWTGDSTRLSDRFLPSDMPDEVYQVVKKAMENLPELTFGGFDVVFGELGAYVVEVNSAPMMTRATAGKYADFFRSLVTTPEPEWQPAEHEIVPTGSSFDAPPDTWRQRYLDLEAQLTTLLDQVRTVATREPLDERR